MGKVWCNELSKLKMSAQVNRGKLWPTAVNHKKCLFNQLWQIQKPAWSTCWRISWLLLLIFQSIWSWDSRDLHVITLLYNTVTACSYCHPTFCNFMGISYFHYLDQPNLTILNRLCKIAQIYHFKYIIFNIIF